MSLHFLRKLVTKLLVSTLLIISFTGYENGDSNIDNNLTGQEVVYTLYQEFDYNVSGIVIFKETSTANTFIVIEFIGTENGLLRPADLHYDDIVGNGAMASALNPVDGDSGISETTLETLDNAPNITYKQLLEIQMSIKVHLSDTESGKRTILAGGNVGLSDTKSDPFGRIEISVCKSN